RILLPPDQRLGVTCATAWLSSFSRSQPNAWMRCEGQPLGTCDPDMGTRLASGKMFSLFPAPPAGWAFKSKCGPPQMDIVSRWIVNDLCRPSVRRRELKGSSGKRMVWRGRCKCSCASQPRSDFGKQGSRDEKSRNATNRFAARLCHLWFFRSHEKSATGIG